MTEIKKLNTQQERIIEFLANTTFREKEILVMHYKTGMSLRQIANLWKITYERVRQIENIAIKQLNKIYEIPN